MGEELSTISTWKDRKSYSATTAQLAEWEEQYQRHFERLNWRTEE